MFIREKELSRKLEEKTHELLHVLEERKDALLKELSCVDKATLTKLRSIMDDYYNAENQLSEYVQKCKQELTVAEGTISHEFEKMKSDIETETAKAESAFVAEITKIRNDFEKQMVSYAESYVMEDYTREVINRIAEESEPYSVVQTTGNSTIQVMSQDAVTREVSKLSGEIGKNICVTPKMFGAVGDGITNDTEAFYKAIESSDVVYLPAGTYLVNFRNIDLVGKTIFGDGYNSVILQRLSDRVFCRVGENTVIRDVRFVTNNVSSTDLFVFGSNGTDFLKYNGHHIHDIWIDGDNRTRCFFYNITPDPETGTYGNSEALITNVTINRCFDGICVNSMGKSSWITKVTFRDIKIRNPERYGVRLYKSNAPKGQITHSIIDNVAVTLKTPNSIGFELCGCACTIINPCTFSDASDGKVTSIRFVYQPRNYYEISTIVGGFVEGNIEIDDVLGTYLNVFGLNALIRDNYNSTDYEHKVYNSTVNI